MPIESRQCKTGRDSPCCLQLVGDPFRIQRGNLCHGKSHGYLQSWHYTGRCWGSRIGNGYLDD